MLETIITKPAEKLSALLLLFGVIGLFVRFLRQASTMQGFGFMWKKDFNWPERKKKKKDNN